MTNFYRTNYLLDNARKSLIIIYGESFRIKNATNEHADNSISVIYQYYMNSKINAANIYQGNTSASSFG